jgi:hypothetical protein
MVMIGASAMPRAELSSLINKEIEDVQEIQEAEALGRHDQACDPVPRGEPSG